MAGWAWSSDWDGHQDEDIDVSSYKVNESRGRQPVFLEYEILISRVQESDFLISIIDSSKIDLAMRFTSWAESN